MRGNVPFTRVDHIYNFPWRSIAICSETIVRRTHRLISGETLYVDPVMSFVQWLTYAIWSFFSLRNLCRALQYAASHVCGSFYRSLYEVNLFNVCICTLCCAIRYNLTNTWCVCVCVCLCWVKKMGECKIGRSFVTSLSSSNPAAMYVVL